MAYWIWYPGDMELYYGLKQNFSRVERGYVWPACWKSEGFRNQAAFRKNYDLEQESAFCVWSNGVGYVMVNENKYPFGREIICGPGKVQISVHAACIEEFPGIYVEGETIFSDGSWTAEDYDRPSVPAGYSKYFTQREKKPSVWEYSEKPYLPVSVKEENGGVLYEFETELTAVLAVKFHGKPRKIRICCGESREEALDSVHCYYSWEPDPDTGKCPRCAVRFAYIPDCEPWEIDLTAIHQYVDIPSKASFSCEDELLNRIWKVAEHTFKLCSGIFFIDGIKRDKWIWSGDAYQSLFVNQYLMADPDINRRTLVALRGNDPMTTHINTILDYSLLWILAVKEHYMAHGDMDFVRWIYPKMVSLMELVDQQLDEHGFVVGRENDWTFIDWADFDKTGAFCPEQMLLAECYKTMDMISRLLEIETGIWKEKEYHLKKQIEIYFWDEEKCAYIDSFISGKRNVTRHANIFAILFDIADDRRKSLLLEKVLRNDRIPQITTPYFKFFELDALCSMGCLEEVLECIKAYWGGMLKRGAVTFWEEYDPSAPAEEQYGMYGDKFGKSLCHAWAASPIYLLEKYFLGVRPLSPGYDTYEVRPRTEFFEELECEVPLGKGAVHISLHGGNLEITPKESKTPL